MRIKSWSRLVRSRLAHNLKKGPGARIIRGWRLLDRIHWRFMTTYILLILIAMQVISSYFNQELESHYINDFTNMMDQQASLLAYSIQSEWEESLETEEEITPLEDIHLMIDRMFSSLPQAEVQILDTNGIVINTGTDNQNIIGQRNTQREVQRALSGTRDDTIRINPQNLHRTQILALPIKVNGEVEGALYLAASMEDMYETIREINLILATGTFIALIFSAIIGVTLSRTITKPIKEMTRQTTAMAEGDFSRRVKVYGKDEIGQLAIGINELSRKLNQALSANEEEKNKLASILFYMSDGVVAADRNGDIILVNHKAESMLSPSENSVLGRKLSEVLDFPAYMREDTLYEKSARFLTEMDDEGETMIVQVSVTPLQGKDSIQGMIAVLQDVTHQEQLERERKEFVANVSHELRTPLTTMKSYVEALSDGAMKDPELAERFLSVIQTETERMIRLVNDLLHLSRMDTKKFDMKVTQVSLQPLIEQVAERFSIPMAERNLYMQLDVEDDLPYIFADRDQINQVMDNIVSNAVKYSQRDGTIGISAYYGKEDQEVMIEVSDEGVGIPKADLKHVFKRFYRVDKARSREMGGTGLGLSITKKMIHAHQGRIDIDSKVGEGTVVGVADAGGGAAAGGPRADRATPGWENAACGSSPVAISWASGNCGLSAANLFCARHIFILPP
jgi:two-component system, OmpR family, sensor histidine kinase VicK